MPGPESVVAPEYLAWLRSLAAAYPAGERRGTLRHIDDAARAPLAGRHPEWALRRPLP